MAPNESKTTTDHDEIRRWAQERGGRPARVKGTERGDDVGILRVDFSGDGDDGDALEPISWEEFFDEFDREGLAFLYQEKTADGQLSRFNKFVRR
ncbi:MAG: hypothetical protein QOE19_3545 [Actinomycetota bacterium]|jgi:hypothetical protein|nr:hypothetical protein [Actinomycetota bacterium]MDQ1664165.1 hypothetical protein [Actinomycetota bacterium]